MSQRDLLDQLRGLSLLDRLAVLEVALRGIREDMATQGLSGTDDAADEERSRALREAALAALPLYEAGGELTAFTALDGEPFYEPS